MTPAQTPSRRGGTGRLLLISLGVGLVGLVLPPVVGAWLDSSTHSGGGFQALYTLVGFYAGVILGPLAFILSAVIISVRQARASKRTT